MWVKILLLFFVFSFLFRTDASFDQDLGRHLRIGEIVWQTHKIPLTNLFSYTYPEYPFINSHWLFELLVYLGQQIIGLYAVLIIKIIVFLLSVWLILKVIPKNQYLLLPVGFIFLHTLRERPELRPEILSFLFSALTIYILESKKKMLWFLPLIQLVWVNAHIYFVVGLILQGIFLLNSRLKRPAVIFVLSIIVSLINPSGIKGFLNPFLYSANYGYTIVENQTMFLLESINFHDPNFLFVKLSALIILLSFIIALVKKRFSVKNFGLAGFGLVLALINVRSFPYLVFISLPATLANLGTYKSKLFFFITIPFLLYESFFYLNGDYNKYNGSDVKPGLEFKESGRKGMDFVLANDLPQPIFNNFDIGSYITYRGWPTYKIFVDGRPEGYPREFFQSIYIPMQSDPQKFAEVDKQYNFQTIIFSHTDQTPWAKTFLTNIVKNPDWKTIYIDDFMIILIKDLNGFKKMDLADLNPGIYQFDSYLSYLRLSLFLAQTGNIQSAQKFAEAGLKLFPQSPLGNALFGIKISNKFWW